MPQGKMKVKAKMPTGVKNKAISKPKDIQKKNRPAQPKRDLMTAAVTKAINESNEMVFKQKATVEGKHFKVIPSEEVKPGTSAVKKDSKLDKGRLPKKK